MVLAALAGTEMAMRDVGLSIELGSGVGAAQAYLAEPAPPIALRPAAAAR
jgi:hypothetical protein